jgi:TonB family protein
MTADWKQWQGRVVGESFPLTEYVAGTAQSGVFLSVIESQKLAIKLMPVDATAESRLSRWKVAEGLSHPHLLRVHQSGRTTIDGEGLLYLVMEYADENLSQVLSQRALTGDEVREMLPPVLEALEYLHAKGFVHGGVKPGNIMAVGEQLKLASDDLMRAGEVVSGPGVYDAPEVRQGVSPGSDVWSLGLTLVEVLTQQKPVSLEATNRCAEALAEPFRGIAQHSVQVDPSVRWKVAEIRDYLVGRKAVAPPKPAPLIKHSAPIPSTTKSRFSYGIPAVGIGVVLIAMAGYFLFPRHSNKEPGAEKSVAMATSPAPAKATEPVREEKPVTKGEAIAPAPAAVKSESGDDAVVNKVLPDVPRRALNTINGKVRVKVRVRVDRDGKVVGSQFAAAGPSRYFANLAMDAARQWTFTPADSDARAWNLQFEFRRSGAEAVESKVDR